MSSRRGRRLVFVHGRTTCAEATRRAKRCCGDRGASWAPPSRGRRQNSCGGAGSREQAAQALKSWLSSHIKRRRGCIFRRAQAVKGCAVGGRRAADAKDRAAARRARDLGMPRCVSYSFWPISGLDFIVVEVKLLIRKWGRQRSLKRLLYLDNVEIGLRYGPAKSPSETRTRSETNRGNLLRPATKGYEVKMSVLK